MPVGRLAWGGLGLAKYKKLVIGIDQSYTRTGISIAVDNKLVKVTSISFKGCVTKSDKRNMLRRILTNILKTNLTKAILTQVICERIRTFSSGSNAPVIIPGQKQEPNKNFISVNYIKATGALIATIVDAAYEFGVEVYSADTKSWKSRIVGTTRASGGDKKLPTIKHVIGLGFESSIMHRGKKGQKVYDDDAADSACIALYGFLPKDQRTLKKEE
jgi:hypothetical protein